MDQVLCVWVALHRLREFCFFWFFWLFWFSQWFFDVFFPVLRQNLDTLFSLNRFSGIPERTPDHPTATPREPHPAALPGPSAIVANNTKTQQEP